MGSIQFGLENQNSIQKNDYTLFIITFMIGNMMKEGQSINMKVKSLV